MLLEIFIGIQATGKSSFFRHRFSDTHLSLSMDMLKTRNRESILFRACLDAKQPMVIDNTNPAKADRARYIASARDAHFTISGYFFQSVFAEAEIRNSQRPVAKRVPILGMKATRKLLEMPTLGEGFDHLYFVKLAEGNTFTVEDWADEVR